MDRFKLIQTSELYSSATSGETRTIAWSHHHQLAMVCTKGLYVMELLPNPTYTSPNLNFKPQFIQRDSGGNPVLDRLGLNVAELANEVRCSVTDTDLFLDKALLPQFESSDSGGGNGGITGIEEGGSERNSFVSVQWIQPFPDDKRIQFLLTLTENHRVKLWGKSRIKGWTVILDISNQLTKCFKDRKWAEARDSKPQNGGLSTASQFRSRALLCATTSISYHHKRLILSQKNGAIIAVSLNVKRTRHYNLGDVTIEQLDIIDIVERSKISVLRVDQSTDRLYVGLNDGTIGCYCLSNGKAKDLGLVWEDVDSVIVSEIVPVDNKRVILVKGSHVVLVTLEVDANKVEAEQIEAFDVGPTSVVSVELIKDIGDAAVGMTFLVAVQEGPWQLMSLLPGSQNAVMRQFEFPQDPVDVMKFSCQGVAQSKGGALWTVIQNGYLDDDASSARLLVFSQADIGEVCEHLLFANCVQDSIDHLESFRIGLQHPHQQPLGKNQNDVMHKVIDSVAQNTGLNRVFFWLCQLVSALSEDELLSAESDRLADQFHNAILCQRAEILVTSPANDQNTRQWAARFLRDHGDINEKIKGVQSASWHCPSCNSPEVESSQRYADCVQCVRGHVWARCVLSLRPCTESSIARCEWCESPAMESSTSKGDNCPLCNGEFAPN